MAKIESDKLFVKDVFQKWYRIPEYQRPFVWGSDQVNELLDDIYSARQSNPEAQYFLGSMVLKKTDKQVGSTKYEEYDLLDGQQRLTTLFLITAVVRDLTPKIEKNKARIEACQKTIYQMENPDDNIPERCRIVFDIRDKVRDFIDKYVKTENGTNREEELQNLTGQKGEDISIRNMANAILTIRRFFETGSNIDEFFPFFRSNVLMIYVAAEALEDAFHLFTVMNNRGIKLRNSDILKAENLAKIREDHIRTRYAKEWESIEEYFAEDFDTFLSHLRTILVKQKALANLLKEYEENIYTPREFNKTTKEYTPKPPLLQKGKDTFEFVGSYFKHYQAIFDVDHYNLANNFELNNQLILMRYGFEAELWVAPLLKYFDKYNTNQILDFLKRLDNKFSADWITGLSPTERIESGNAIIKEIEAASSQATLFASTVFQTDKYELLRAFSGGIYGRGYARYLLLKIDLLHHGHTTKFAPPSQISIEHILPQTPDAASQWVKDFTELERLQWTNRMGNLILLSRRKNTAQGNRDFAEKKAKYFAKNVELFSHSVRIFNAYSTWTLADLKKNHKETLINLMSLYGYSVTDDEYEAAVK